MVDRLQPNAEAAIGYLLWINHEAPLYLERMESAGSENPTARIYNRRCGLAQAFVTANNGHDFQRNVYYMPNARLLNGKRLKANTAGSDFLWVDLDGKDYPGSEAERLDMILCSADRGQAASQRRPAANGYRIQWRRIPSTLEAQRDDSGGAGGEYEQGASRSVRRCAGTSRRQSVVTFAGNRELAERQETRRRAQTRFGYSVGPAEFRQTATDLHHRGFQASPSEGQGAGRVKERTNGNRADRDCSVAAS